MRFHTSHRAALLAVVSALHLGCSSDDAPRDGGDASAGGGSPAVGGTSNGGRGSGGTAGSAAGGASGSTSGGAGGNAPGGAANTGGERSTDGAAPFPFPDGGLFESIGSPWGLAPSASSSRAFASWMPKMAAGGTTWVRGFDAAQTSAVLKGASDSGLQLSGILVYSKSSPQTFPVDDLEGWKAYVTRSVNDTRGKVHYWEVWNEPPNFSENKSPADYGAIVKAAYDAAKAADPTVQIGVAVQSVNLNFLAQALDAGAKDHFDYVTVHPYETLGLVADGWDVQYLSIVPTIRKLLADKSPSRANAPVIITEVGEPVGNGITADHQAETLVKAYVLALAGGVARVHWFEPLDGDSGPFGLVENDGTERPSYVALRALTTHLGTVPSYQGHVLIDGECCGFVFENEGKNVLVAWTRPHTPATLDVGPNAVAYNPQFDTPLPVSSAPLMPLPLIVTNVSDALLEEAHRRATEPMPWLGDYSKSTSVTWTPAADKGLHPLGASKLAGTGADQARDISGGPGISFTVDPNFLSYTKTKVIITAVVRRNGADNAGFNLKYESTTGSKGAAEWFTVPEGTDWTTKTWTLDDTQFVGKWGYHFSFDSDSTQYSKYSVRSVTVSRE